MGWDGTCPHCLSTFSTLSQHTAPRLSFPWGSLLLSFTYKLGWDLGSHSSSLLHLASLIMSSLPPPGASPTDPRTPMQPGWPRRWEELTGAPAVARPCTRPRRSSELGR